MRCRDPVVVIPSWSDQSLFSEIMQFVMEPLRCFKPSQLLQWNAIQREAITKAMRCMEMTAWRLILLSVLVVVISESTARKVTDS